MGNLTDVFLDGVKVKILAMGPNQVKLLMPKHAPGPVVINFIGPNGSLDFIAVRYVPARNQNAMGKVTIRNFIQENATLSAQARSSLKAAISNSSAVVAVTCIGYQSWSYDRPIDAQTALKRAQAACGYLKSLNRNLAVQSLVARTTLIGPASRKLQVLFKESN